MSESNSSETIRQARMLFKSYSRMKMEIKQMSESIECLTKTIEQNVDADIYNASVSHGHSGEMGVLPNISSGKTPQIAENIDKIRGRYYSEISQMKYRINIFQRATNSVQIYVNYLDWTGKTILTRRYLDEDKKNFEEISQEIHLSVDSVKKRERKLIEDYIKTLHFDISAVLEMLK